jgi:hypothetical protein
MREIRTVTAVSDSSCFQELTLNVINTCIIEKESTQELSQFEICDLHELSTGTSSHFFFFGIIES